jgi:hypothetical protein
MQFNLTIKCDGEAFEGDPATEVSRILRKAAERLAIFGDNEPAIPLVDVNGNLVGTASFTEEN